MHWPGAAPLRDITFSRLHAAVDDHFEEHRLARRQCVAISRAELIPCVDTMGPHAKAAGEGGEVDGRIYEIHPDKALGAVEQLQPLLDDAVASIVEHDEDHRQLLVSGGPQRLDRVHGAAVAE